MITEQIAFPRHREVEALIASSAQDVFDFLDDPARLTGHMSKSSWMMGGGSMVLDLDAAGGQSVGSKMTLRGRAFGLDLYLEEIVIERSAPFRKVWQTIGAPRLWIIAQYRLGFEISALPEGCRVRVFIDYSLPASGLGRWLGSMFGSVYAKWCTDRMLGDARAHFARLTHIPQPAR
jgi:hypothetical protein